jgi:prolyl oligopeptidase
LDLSFQPEKTMRIGAVLVCAVSMSALAGQPETPKQPVTDTYHGVAVSDPYRWLEDWNDPKVKAWSEAQNAYARGVLDKLPGVDAIRARVTEVMSKQTVSYGGLEFEGGKLFALKRQPPKQQPFLVMMDSPEHPEKARVLVDPNEMNKKGTTAIDWFAPSPSGAMVAVSMSEGGSEAGDVHVFDTTTGKEVYEVIPHCQNGTAGGSLTWEHNEKGFFYTRYPRGTERPEADHEFYMQVYFHKLGTPTEQDTYELGKDFPKIAEIILDSDEEGVVLASMQKGDGGEFQHYVRTEDKKWTQIDTYEDRVVQAVLGPSKSDKSTVYLVSRKDAPRGKMLALTFDSEKAGAKLSDAKVIIPEGKDTLVSEFADEGGNIAVSEGFILATYQLGGPSELRAFDRAGKPVAGPKQFEIGATGQVVAGNRGDVVLFSDASYVESPAWFSFDAKSGKTAKVALTQPSPVDFSDCEVTREFASSKDGTKVPVTIIMKKGTKKDGSNPCMVTAYGGYGVNITPGYRAAWHVLLEQGVIIAEANIRGGGEFGEEWHAAGNLTKKQNVFDDFYAAAQHMVDAKYTTAAKLSIEGGSNGGLLMGATLTQHPDLCKCVVSHVGIYDMLRVELSANGAFNVTEFGTVKDKAQFDALYAYSPYHHVESGRKYPAVLFLTGANDPRVDPMQSRKMTARLQDVGATCLLRTSANSGHGIGSSLSERIEQNVDVDAFLFSELGVAYKPMTTKGAAAEPSR